MIPDAEIISLLGTILTKLEVGEFTIKVGLRSNPQRCRLPDLHTPVS